MGKINSIKKQTDNRYVNLYNVKATSVHDTPVNYFVASRAKDVGSLKITTRRNDPDGVIIYAIYGEAHDKVVLIRQYRYTLGDYIYEFPAGLVEPDENYHEGAIRELMRRQAFLFPHSGSGCLSEALFYYGGNDR